MGVPSCRGESIENLGSFESIESNASIRFEKLSRNEVEGGELKCSSRQLKVTFIAVPVAAVSLFLLMFFAPPLLAVLGSVALVVTIAIVFSNLAGTNKEDKNLNS
jgi:hypothetical protein